MSPSSNVNSYINTSGNNSVYTETNFKGSNNCNSNNNLKDKFAKEIENLS